MSEPLRMPDGRLYEGVRVDEYFGKGIRKSCAKCSQHKTSRAGEFKLLKPWGICCKACRGVE
jgi:hypothetical protein